MNISYKDCLDADGNFVDPTYSALIGQIVSIRTVTMTNVGRLEAVLPEAFLLSGAVWIAVTNRFSEYCANGSAKEVEPFAPDAPVYVAKGGVIDITPMPCVPVQPSN